jgi:Sec-independent protein translocase protein TatA
MDFLGIGPVEFLLIFILAFLFFGPEKLPGIASRAGKIYRAINHTAGEMHKALTEEVSIRKEMDHKLASFNDGGIDLEEPTEKPAKEKGTDK